MGLRDTSKDGFLNRLEFFLLTHFAFVWRMIQAVPFARTIANRLLVNRAVNKTKHRPHQFSTFSSYTSWQSLTDKVFSGRHLPEADAKYIDSLPPINKVTELFRRPGGSQRESDKSTLLFSHFAQWFTDGFLRTDRSDIRKNTSNHEIDLSPLYGIKEIHTRCLRTFNGGLLKSQTINDEEYPPYYFNADGTNKPEFSDLPILFLPDLQESQRVKLFAMGVERANNQVGYVMLNTLFLREHNRIAKELAREYSSWDDERLFQTSRNVLIVLLIKIVIEEYINHITPYYFKFRAEPASFWNADWSRPNWMTVEFNLLYRWHSLVGNTVKCGNRELPVEQTFFNNDLLTSKKLSEWFVDASSQPAGDIGLFNTHVSLLMTDERSIQMGRDLKLRSYNDYRVAFRYPRITSFEQISSRDEVVNALKNLYESPDQVELYVGLFAEDVREHSAVSPLIGRMVGVDAFSQALTNPLLSVNVFNKETFSKAGFEIIQSTRRLEEIVRRNNNNGSLTGEVTFTRPGKVVH